VIALKKALLAIALVAMISLLGCQKKENVTTITTPDGKTITATTSGKTLSVTTK
jgi:uncharacterized lipoprotein YehR (DUF1307 family)